MSPLNTIINPFLILIREKRQNEWREQKWKDKEKSNLKYTNDQIYGGGEETKKETKKKNIYHTLNFEKVETK